MNKSLSASMDLISEASLCESKAFDFAPMSQSEVYWKYDSPRESRNVDVRANLTQHNYEKKPEAEARTPIRIMKRHVSSPLPGSSSFNAKKTNVKSLITFEQMLDGYEPSNNQPQTRSPASSTDSCYFQWSDELEISDEAILAAVEKEEKKDQVEKIKATQSFSSRLRQLEEPLSSVVNKIACKRSTDKKLTRSPIPLKQLKTTHLDFDSSFDDAIFNSIPLEQLCSKPSDKIVDLVFDPVQKLSQVVETKNLKENNKTTRKFFTHRREPEAKKLPEMTAPQRLRAEEEKRKALIRLEASRKKLK